MSLKELIQSRYSVRSYLNKDVEKDKIDYILECARLAPSACNFQPWYFYIVTNSDAKAKIAESYNREWFKMAPLYIVVCENTDEAWKRKFDNKSHADIDAAIVSEHICLATEEVGLGTCWVCNFEPQMLKKSLFMPTAREPIAIFPIGYIDTSSIPEKKRKPINEISEWI